MNVVPRSKISLKPLSKFRGPFLLLRFARNIRFLSASRGIQPVPVPENAKEPKGLGLCYPAMAASTSP
jgi:hypothetical protein